MTKPFSLQIVLDLLQTRTDEATRQLARLIAAEQDAQRKLDMLKGYRDDYFARFRQATQNGLRQADLLNYQEFLNRLDEAIQQQQHAVALQRQHTAAGQLEWQRQRAKHKAIDALADRHQANEARLELRQEQKNQDEFAARVGDDEHTR
ncbi:MAG TPA: flagellar export protein FliJ [Accumulibacter sp.]|nr:flagellar export protein FliJ [Accumulibacter sp.]HQC79385.1 flagellar export protein FliJ [Accumulibacter sp.]